MFFTILIGMLFLAIVFIHYLQGFFSSAISAILAVLAAVLAFSWHEAIVERFLQGKAANIAHSMVLVALFAAIYLILRIIFDKAIPEGVSLPAAIDRAGGAVMGMVAATFALGTLAIAAEELPLGASVVGYTKYETSDPSIQLQNPNGGQSQTGYNNNELNSKDAGRFAENDRQQLFPIFPAGVDEIVVKTVAHLSGSGSMQGSQPLEAIHPDFLQELYGQRAGIQGGAQHVTLNLTSAPEPAISIKGIYTVSKVRVVDSEYGGVRNGGVTTPLKLDKPFTMVTGRIGATDLLEGVVYGTAANDKDNGKEMALVVIRITFGPDAADHGDGVVRLSPGSIRLVAHRPDKNGDPYDYYPIGTLEPGTPYPMLFADKPDDSIFVSADRTGGTRVGIDAVFAVDKAGVLDEVPGKQPKIADGTFIEIKRMVREDLAGKPVDPWTATAPGLTIGSLHQVKLHPNVVGSSPLGDAATSAALAEGEVLGFGQGMEMLKKQVGPLSADQQSSMEVLKKDITAKIRANPKDLLTKAFLEDYHRRFREILTPAQQAKLDAFAKEQGEAFKKLMGAPAGENPPPTPGGKTQY